MNDQEILDRAERAARSVVGPDVPYEALLRRRDRKRRNQRIAAGVVGIAVFVAAVWIVTSGGRFDRTQTPAVRPTPPPSVVSPGTFEDVHGWIAFRTGEDLLAVDPADPGEIISLGSFDELSLASPFAECPSGQVYLNPCGPVGWSRDGTRLLLSTGSRLTPLSSLSVLGDDGSREPLVGTAPTRWGAISPDGSQVVYSQGRWRGPNIVDADGGTPRSLADPCPRQEVRGELRELCGEMAAEATAWSPDGSTIAWLDFGEGTIPGAGHENFLSFVNPDGTGLREGVATLPGTFGGNSLVWSPDGSQLAFWMADDDDRNGQIFVINADGTGLRQVTHQGENQWPTWSPDGSRIAFVHDGALYTMAQDGSDMMEVEGVSPEGPIAWNPVP
jgi:WD40-like Beta Propeller Repeat